MLSRFDWSLFNLMLVIVCMCTRYVIVSALQDDTSEAERMLTKLARHVARRYELDQ